MALTFPSIRGHERIIETLTRARRSGTVAHAYLFAGPDGVGKELLARTFAASLLCPAEAAPCGECQACQRTERGSHPDLLVIEREGQFIKIDRVREASRVVRYAPIEGKYRVVIIKEAETLHEAAANALLKTLEEPSSQTVFVVLSARPHMLLQTILSRCQRLSFSALDRAVVADVLVATHGLEPTIADTVAGMADGSLGAAVALIDGAVLERRADWLARLERLPGATPDEVLAIAEEMTQDKTVVAALLDLTRLWVRDLLLANVGAPADRLTNRDRVDTLLPLAQRSSREKLLADLDRIAETERALRGNVNARLAAERLLLHLAA